MSTTNAYKRAAWLGLVVLSLAACKSGGGDGEGGESGGGSESGGVQAQGTGSTSGGDGAGQQQAAIPREDVTLTLWHSYREDEEQALNQVVTLFNSQHPHTTIETLAIPFDAYPDRITAATPRGRGPDFFIFAHDRIGDWADEEIIEPLTVWAGQELLTQYFEKTVRALVYRRGLYGLPLAFKSVVLYYNPSQVPTPPTTTDELVAAARNLTSSQGDGRYGLVYQYNLLYFHAPWLHGFGGRVIDDNGNLAVVSDEAVQALQFIQRMYQQDHLLPENVYSQSVVSLFSSGRAAMVISGPWFRGELPDSANWQVAPLPTISANNQPARPFMSSEAIMVSAYSDHKERAFEAARWLTTDLEVARILMNVGHIPVALRAAYENEADVDPVLLVFRDQMETAVPMPNVPLMRRVWGHYDTALFDGIKNGNDARTVLTTAAERIAAE